MATSIVGIAQWVSSFIVPENGTSWSSVQIQNLAQFVADRTAYLQSQLHNIPYTVILPASGSWVRTSNNPSVNGQGETATYALTLSNTQITPGDRVEFLGGLVTQPVYANTAGAGSGDDHYALEVGARVVNSPTVNIANSQYVTNPIGYSGGSGSGNPNGNPLYTSKVRGLQYRTFSGFGIVSSGQYNSVILNVFTTTIPMLSTQIVTTQPATITAMVKIYHS